MGHPGAFRPESASLPVPIHVVLKSWDDDSTAWHYSFVHPGLLRYIERITGQRHSAEPMMDTEQFKVNRQKTWFLPFCGKTMDVSYLLSQGYRVFGVETSKKVIEQMDREQNLGLIYNEKEKLFKGMNDRVQIYCGDLFTAPLEKYGPFDYVFDKMAFGTVDLPLREKYIASIAKALRKPDGSWHNFKYLMEVSLHENIVFGGSSKNPDYVELPKYFEPWANVTNLSRAALYRRFSDIDRFNRYYLITPPQ